MVKNGNNQRVKRDGSGEREERGKTAKPPPRRRLTVVRRGDETGDMGDWVIDEIE